MFDDFSKRSKAVQAALNLAKERRWSDIGLTAAQPIRDLWTHKDLGDSNFGGTIRAHGSILLKVGMPTR